ncbi:uncharacterized protein LOC124374803, partial [Homalodisca vitripennis]|uniref:uncharacterized protein LOC124374803 n=1 Tax=Homalodisca vitripennis TaxID=197043 RepID=UPI001EEA63D3
VSQEYQDDSGEGEVSNDIPIIANDKRASNLGNRVSILITVAPPPPAKQPQVDHYVNSRYNLRVYVIMSNVLTVREKSHYASFLLLTALPCSLYCLPLTVTLFPNYSVLIRITSNFNLFSGAVVSL